MRKVIAMFLGSILGLGLGSPLFSEEALTEDDGSVAYVIEDIQGSRVQVLEDGAKQWNSAQEGQFLESGDEIKVGEGSEAALVLNGETTVHLTENSGFKVEEISANETGGFLSRLKLLTGRLLADVKKNLESSKSTFEVDTNGVVCGVRGTAFELNAAGENLEAIVHEGKIELSGTAVPRSVMAGQYFSFRAGKLLLQRKLEKRELRGFLKWREARKRIFEKRKQRLEDVQKHLRKPWERRHPRAKKAILRKILQNHGRH